MEVVPTAVVGSSRPLSGGVVIAVAARPLVHSSICRGSGLLAQTEISRAQVGSSTLLLLGSLSGALIARRIARASGSSSGSRKPSSSLASKAVATDASTVARKEALAQKEAAYRAKQARSAPRGDSAAATLPTLASLPRLNFVAEDGLLQPPLAEEGVRASVYAIFGPDEGLQFVGISRNAQASLRAHFARMPQLCESFAVFNVLRPDRSLLNSIMEAWTEEGKPLGNDRGELQAAWESPMDARKSASPEQLAALTAAAPAQVDARLKEIVQTAEQAQAAKFVERGCYELLMFDGKLKAKGLLDLDLSAPAGKRLPEGGVSAAFSVTLRRSDGEEVVCECPMDMTILEAAEEAGVELESSCKSGACSSCAAKVVQGEVDQADQSFLDAEQEAEGYVLTCVCYPRSDLVIETDKQREVA